MDEPEMTRISKYLSRYLRHRPQALGLTLAPGGWVEVDTLLQACATHGFTITRDELQEVVDRNDKQRFAFDETGARIRANQGHSVAVDLQLTPATPPDTLYHGSDRGTITAIEREGLRKMRRHHVHLSADVATALRVGRRHGVPVVFAVNAGAMQAAGYTFYCSENGVWLADSVPPEYLRQLQPIRGKQS